MTKKKSTLKEVYEVTKPLMDSTMALHQMANDYLCSLRFQFTCMEGAEIQLTGLEAVLGYQEGLRAIAQSYHQAVATHLKDEEKEML